MHGWMDKEGRMMIDRGLARWMLVDGWMDDATIMGDGLVDAG